MFAALMLRWCEPPACPASHNTHTHTQTHTQRGCPVPSVGALTGRLSLPPSSCFILSALWLGGAGERTSGPGFSAGSALVVGWAVLLPLPPSALVSVTLRRRSPPASRLFLSQSQSAHPVRSGRDRKEPVSKNIWNHKPKAQGLITTPPPPEGHCEL